MSKAAVTGPGGKAIATTVEKAMKLTASEKAELMSKLVAMELHCGSSLKISVTPFDAETSLEAVAFRQAFSVCATENLQRLFESKLAEVTAMESQVATQFAQADALAREGTLRKSEIAHLVVDIEKASERVAGLQEKCRTQQQQSSLALKNLQDKEAQMATESAASSSIGDPSKTDSIVAQIEEMERDVADKDKSNQEQRQRLEDIKVHIENRKKRVQEMLMHESLKKQLAAAVEAQKNHMLAQVDAKIGEMMLHVAESRERNREKKISIDEYEKKNTEYTGTLTESQTFITQMKEARQIKEQMAKILEDKNVTLRQEVKLKDVCFIQAVDARSKMQSETAACKKANEAKDKACKELQARLKALKAKAAAKGVTP